MPRPKGLPKTGGRKKGTPNKITAQREQEIAASGLTPLDYMLAVLRDEANPRDVRLDAAAKAAPYCHAKLIAKDEHSTGEQTVTVVVETGVARE